MTSARRAVLIAYLLAVAILCLWVPWNARYQGEGAALTVNAGYAPLWHPPRVLKPEFRDKERMVHKSVDGTRWALQILACSTLFAVAFLLLPYSQISNPKSPIPDAGADSNETSHTK